MRKVFFPEWDSLGQDFVVRAFGEEGYQLIAYPIPQAEPVQDKRTALVEDLVSKIMAGEYDFVFTVNFLPVVAIACKACRILYLSWVYDSPCVEVYSETVAYDTNRVFIFDSHVVRDLMNKGVETVFYLPMAADVAFYDKVCGGSLGDSAQKSKGKDSGFNSTHSRDLAADISFVGSLYSQPRKQFASLMKGTEYLQGYLNGLMEAQLLVYGVNFLEEALSTAIIYEMQELCMLPQRVHSMETIAWIYAHHYLAREVTSRERLRIARQLTAMDIDFNLFSGENVAMSRQNDGNGTSSNNLEGINDKGAIDYYSQSPLVFRHSKINLNISLRSIQTGIPLRAFDIMGCGGFLLTNFQADLLEHFVPDEDFVYYTSIDDLFLKTEYYLGNETKRKRIARNGYEKVKKHHTYRHRIREMLHVALQMSGEVK